MYQQGAGWVRRVGFAFAIVVAHGRAHQQQQVRGLAGGGEKGNVAAEGKARDDQFRCFGVAAAGVVDNGQAVFRFATAVIVFAAAVADAAQVGQVTVEAQPVEGFGCGLDDFVGVGAALQRVGVVDDRHALRGGLRRQENGFERADGAVDAQNFRLVHDGVPCGFGWRIVKAAVGLCL